MAHSNSGIYEIRNLENGKRYIGSAVNPPNRKRQHFQSLARGDHHSVSLQRAWNKYGADKFKFIQLIICSKENLITYEQDFIDWYKPEYNIAPKAGSQLGFKMSDESKKKLSEAAKRTKNFTGHKHSEETKNRIRKTKTGVKLGKYGKERVEKTSIAMRASKSVLNEELVRKGKQMRRLGAKAQSIADCLGCSIHAVYDFMRGRTYSWVE